MQFGLNSSSVSFTILSDTHDTFPSLSKYTDVLIHCGDVTDAGGIESHRVAIDALAKAPAELKLVIPGNHDVDLDAAFWHSEAKEDSREDSRESHAGKRASKHVKPDSAKLDSKTDESNTLENSTTVQDTNAVLIEDVPGAVQAAQAVYTTPTARAANIHLLTEGVHTFTLTNGTSFSVYATPYTPAYGTSVFQYPTAHDRFNPADATPTYATNTSTTASRIPDYPGVDVLISHGPPAYVLDATERGGGAGCRHLLRAVGRARPLLHCFGHVHGARGVKRVEWREPVRAVSPATGSKRKRCNSESIHSHATGSAYVESSKSDRDNEDPGFDELPREFIGENQACRAGFARVQAVDATQKGKQTLFVNAALGHEDGRTGRVPYVVDIVKASIR